MVIENMANMYIEKEIIVDRTHIKEHMPLEFYIGDYPKELNIEFKYAPKVVEDIKSLESAFSNGIDNSVVPIEDIMKEVKLGRRKLNNLITLSLNKDGEYIGAAHRQNDVMHIKLGDNNTLGFNIVKRNDGYLNGKYKLVISFHGIYSNEVKLNLRVWGS